MPQAARQEKIVPVTFGGSKYQVTVDVYPRGFIVKRTVLDGHNSPLTGVLSSLCADQIRAAIGQEV